jgi:hypothetical protein
MIVSRQKVNSDRGSHSRVCARLLIARQPVTNMARATCIPSKARADRNVDRNSAEGRSRNNHRGNLVAASIGRRDRKPNALARFLRPWLLWMV